VLEVCDGKSIKIRGFLSSGCSYRGFFPLKMGRKKMLIAYKGKNENLEAQVRDYNHSYSLCSRAQPKIQRRIIEHIELRLLSLIDLAASGDNYDKKWLIANRIELNNIFENLRKIRVEINLPMTPKTQYQMQYQMLHLEKLFANAIEKKEDYAEAVYMKSAEQGDAFAQNNLGDCYRKGQGIQQDYTQAVYWYMKSAEQGNALAQNNLGDFCKNGGSATLAKALGLNTPQLQSLNLWGNQIDEKSVIELAEALKTNTTLQSLNLRGSRVGDSATIAIAKALETNTGLRLLDLSDNQIGKSGFVALLNTLKNNTTLQSLNVSGNLIEKKYQKILDFSVTSISRNVLDWSFSDCNLDDKFIDDYLIPLLQSNDKLRILRLNDNKLTYTGIRRLSVALAKHQYLESIDLSNNRITCVKELFEKLQKDFRKYPALQTLLINQNFIETDCKPLFQKKISTDGQIIYYYDFTKTSAQPRTSLFDVNRQISREDWVVSLVCKKGTEHAMIYMEGMKKWGQCFLERYHITAESMIGLANVLIESPDLKFFNPEGYHFTTKPISKVNGNILRDLVETDKKGPINFSKFYPSSSKGMVNCLKWCLNKLEHVDIHIDPNLFGLPSATAKGSVCVLSDCAMM
jgi:hypothetical protein